MGQRFFSPPVWFKKSVLMGYQYYKVKNTNPVPHFPMAYDYKCLDDLELLVPQG